MTWYNSSFGFYAGLGVLALGLGGGFGLCAAGERSDQERYLPLRDGCGGCEGFGACSAVEPAVIQGQVLGNPEPETCRMIDGVLYCSSIDGKVLSDFVAEECYQSPEMLQPSPERRNTEQ
ncbi:MAG: hypothetical protein Q8R53_02165 [Nanoarchaeota archaeon]|nr:hypothetical protein [Nanoarchaeota archaeon]